MNKSKLFKHSVTTRNGAYGVTFYANERNEVIATVENSSAQVMHQDVGIVDLFGHKTRVPGAVYRALLTPSYDTDTYQARLIERFKRICAARLMWSVGCFAVL